MTRVAVLSQVDSEKYRKGIERRVWVRYSSTLHSACQPLGARGPNDPVWAASIKDVSSGGIGMEVVRRFEPGTTLVIDIPEDGDYDGDTLLASVVYVKALPKSKWLLGCAFISPLDEDIVQRLAQPQQEDPATEECAPGYHQDADECRQTDSPAAVVVDNIRWRHLETGRQSISRRLYLTGRWPLAAGSVLKLWLGNKTTESECTRLWVRTCEQHGAEWMILYSIAGKPHPSVVDWIRGTLARIE